MTNIPSGLEKFSPIDRWLLMSRTIQAVELDGEWAEFGVAHGKTARFIRDRMPRNKELWLFDSWQGLPADWHYGPNEKIPKGHFKCRPPIIDGTIIVEGMFHETLPKWEPEVMAFMHIDCDLYASCRDVLQNVPIVPGTVIFFDEIHGFPYWKEGEWKAWDELGLDYEWIGRSSKYRASLKVL